MTTITTSWTADQILAFAPDASAAKDSKALAVGRKWLNLGQSEQAVWGECQGSGKLPYQTQIDLSEPAFKCTCPSRKLPCKHSLGLFLLLANQSDAFEVNPPPVWVAAWLTTRNNKRQPKKQGEAEAALAEPVANAVKEPARKRPAEREAKVRAGLVELELWLRDLIRQGLGNVQSRAYSFWDKPALRMEDAQAKGLARELRDLAGFATPGGNTNRQAKLLERLARLYLLVEGYKHLESLPAATQSDIRTLIGWTLNQSELMAQASSTDILRDRWLVVGQRIEGEEKIRTQFNWLWGRESRRPALILNFAAPGQHFESNLLAIGMEMEAELVFYPSGYPMRAIIKQRYGVAQSSFEEAEGYSNLLAASQAHAEAVVRQPWLEQFPLTLVAITPYRENQKWVVRDVDGRILHLSERFQAGWQLLALSGGHQMTIFGELSEEGFLPLSVWADKRLIAF